MAVSAVSDEQPQQGPRSPLTRAQRAQVRFVLELVDQLAAIEGFDLNQLRSPSTGRPLGPAIGRMRAELERHDEEDTDAEGRARPGS